MQEKDTWKILKVDENWHGKRLDLFLEENLSITRSRAKKLIEGNHVFIDGIMATKGGIKLKKGSIIRVELVEEEEEKFEPLPNPDLDVPVIYEDDYIAVIEKRAGLVVHPACGHKNDTLVNALIAKFRKLSSLGGSIRAGIVHRLDKDTSGLMIIVKDEKTHEILSDMFKDRKITKVYIAITIGNSQKELGIIDKPIGRHPTDRKKMTIRKDGRSALTIYRIIKRNPPYNLVLAKILTGRTHQVRIHLKSINLPIIGDEVYGKKHPLLNRQALHSSFLSFTHPITGQKLELFSPPPIDMTELMVKLDLYMDREELKSHIKAFLDEIKNLCIEPYQVSS